MWLVKFPTFVYFNKMSNKKTGQTVNLHVILRFVWECFWKGRITLAVHFIAKMLKDQSKGAALFNHLGGQETEMFLKRTNREQISNRVVRRHDIEGEKSDKVVISSKGGVVVEILAKTRRRVVVNNSAENWSGSSTEEESDEKEDLAAFNQYLADSEGSEVTMAVRSL